MRRINEPHKGRRAENRGEARRIDLPCKGCRQPGGCGNRQTGLILPLSHDTIELGGSRMSPVVALPDWRMGHPRQRLFARRIVLVLLPLLPPLLEIGGEFI